MCVNLIVMDQRLTFEIADRRRAQTQIDDLKRNCDQFVRERDVLSKKLGELNQIVDKLIDEKKMKKYDPNWKVDLRPYSNAASLEPTKISSLNWDHIYSTINGNNHLIIDNNYINSTLCHAEQNPIQKSSSEAFKFKLFHCLPEIKQKAEEISKLSEHVYP